MFSLILQFIFLNIFNKSSEVLKDLIPEIVGTIILDEIFFKFLIEEEDIIYLTKTASNYSFNKINKYIYIHNYIYLELIIYIVFDIYIYIYRKQCKS